MITKAPDLEKTIVNLRIIAGQIAGAVETGRMEREASFADLINSEVMVQLIQTLINIQERRVSEDVSIFHINLQLTHKSIFNSFKRVWKT